MLKTILLASTMVIAAPAFAQDAKPATAPADQQETTVPTAQTEPATPVTQSAPAETAEAAPVTQETPAQVAATPDATQPAEAAAATQAAKPSQEQVAQAVGRDWSNYDADKNDQLSAAEFGSWMTALRQASEPTFAPGSAEAKSWEAQAFAAADADKNASVNKQELTVFLTPKAS